MSEKKRKHATNAANEDFTETVVKIKKRRKSKKHDETLEEEAQNITNNCNLTEEKVHKKKKKKKLDEWENSANDLKITENIEDDTERKHKKKRKLHTENKESQQKDKDTQKNEASTEADNTKAEPVDDIQCDLILNVAEIPVKKTETKKEKEAKQKKLRQENENYTEKAIGLPGIPSKTNKKVVEGVQLGFKNANLYKAANFNKKGDTAKKAYGHLINGDIILAFKNCNLDEIKGYGI